MLVGYERSHQGSAAGMRTLGLMSMAWTALTVFADYAGSCWPHLSEALEQFVDSGMRRDLGRQERLPTDADQLTC